MGRGRAPCCDKDLVKKGPWSPEEDSRLISFIQQHGHANWRALPKQAGLLRCGKSCRLRWVNYLRPDIKRGNFSQEELGTITKLHQLLGNKWSKIASQMAGRTDNEIKNVWHTHLKKRLIVKESKSTTSCSLVMLNGHGHDHEGILRSGSSSENEQDSQSAGQVLLLNQTTPPPPHEMVEASIISSSHCSHDAERDIDVMGGGNSNTQNAYDEEVIEIPFEPNLDFWDMLDADYSNNDSEVPISDTIFEEENKREVESWWSLAYLEKELGLEAATMDGNGATMPVPVPLPPELS